MSHLISTYARLPVEFVRGEGVYLFDNKGKKYLDALAGIAVCGIGHANSELSANLKVQADKLWHTSSLFAAPEQEKAAQTLCRISGMKRAFFANSGAEANEAAIKLTRLHAEKLAIENPQVISFHGGFHGRTFGAMAATANPKIRAHFFPHLRDFVHLPFNDFAAIEAHRFNPKIVAVIFECVQGEGGLHPAEKEFVQKLRKICDERNWLLICDEVQIGMARSGKWFGFQHYDISPDAITMAKALGNGLPVGALLVNEKTENYFQLGMHGSTFGGGNLVINTVNKVLEIYERDNLPERAEKIGNYLKNLLNEKLGGLPIVKDIRGLGLMLGIELNRPIENLVAKGLEKSVVINVTAGKVIRLLPPLIFKEEHCRELVDVLFQLLKNEQ
ncbi:MAG: aspartate aminotransferase family protein [Cardiobacteriaceae bacterium]|nr:aspartate aminotransferase family protein [Cardiobacteriaceae bacterium]